MKRRRFVTALAASPAATALLAQQQTSTPPPPGATQPPAPFNRTPPAAVELPKLEFTVADDVADAKLKFFTAPQFAALRKLSDILLPSVEDNPGALDAKAPEFLDFLLAESPSDRQSVYRTGLDALNAGARKRFNKAFADVDATEAATLLEPLKQPWTYDPPADPLAKFLRAAKQDVRTATQNSREYVSAAEAGGRRGMGGIGSYWLPLD
jgi:hypothetical protein